MEVPVLKYTGGVTDRNIFLPGDIFAIKPNDHAIYLDIKYILANKRQGTHKAKERGEIRGSTRKIKKQKGTGTARAGDIKSPIFRGGGRVFGPRPRDYSMKLNKKVRQLARKSVLSYKAKEKNIVVLEEFSFDLPKTKNYISLLKNLDLDREKTLLILAKSDKNIVLSSNNIKTAKVMLVGQINTYDLLDAKKILISDSALKVLSQNMLQS